MSVDSNAWTSLAAVKRHLKIDDADTEFDAELELLINACYKMLEGYIHHPLKSADYTKDLDGDGTNTLLLPIYPINSVTSIYDDPEREFAADTLIASTDYVVDNEEEVGTVRLFKNTTAFTKGIKNIRIAFNAGYTTIPSDAELACILLVSWFWNRGGAEAMTAQSMGGKSESYNDDALPMFIRQMVGRFKEFSV